MFYVLCITICETQSLTRRLRLKLVFDATFLHETLFYVLCFTWPRFLHHKTKIGLIIEGAFCHGTRFYVLCFTIYLTWNNVLRFMHYLCKIPPFCPYTIVLVSFDVTFSYETMFYVLCFTIYLTQISTLLDQNCATIEGVFSHETSGMK